MKKTVLALCVALCMGAMASVSANDSAGLSAQGQLFMQLQQMQQEIAALRGMVEEQQNQIHRLTEESRDRYQALDSRLSHEQGAQPVVSDTDTDTVPPPANPPADVAPGDPAKEQQFYEASYSLIQARDFDRAQQAFTAFLGRYPQGKYAANAYYWLGEIALVKNDLQAAGQAFASVIQDWPQHAKVADSTYKLAVVEQRLGRFERAEAMFRQVISQHPSSSAANLARQDLQRLHQ
ncbi:MAG: tol-pal system protein YbgF [Thiopseudomonas sp.]|nr:tol-pal system protein YbgF [Thiopseudomonas sp.]